MLKPIPYIDKNVEFSASDFNKPDYLLWIKNRTDAYKNEEKDEVFSPSFVGSLIHENSESLNETNVIKEFSTTKYLDGTSIGGTIDRIVLNSDGEATIEDIKTGGHFPMLQKWKNGETSEDWIIQLSVYRWLIIDIFKEVSNFGNIHVFVLGHQKNKEKMPITWSTDIDLLNTKEIEELMARKILISKRDVEPNKDCETWRCGYCEYSTYCQTRGATPKEFS